MKAYAAEFFGTATLALIVVVSMATGPQVSLPIIAAATLGVFVYTIGSLSGSHINPAVTFGLWVHGKISQAEMLNYIVSQLAGALVALGVAWILIEDLPGALSSVQLRVGNDPIVGLAELVGALIFGFGIMTSVLKKVKNELAGFVISGSLFLGLIIASSVSNGILNPAVAVALGSLDLMYILGPVTGMVLGMKAAMYLYSR